MKKEKLIKELSGALILEETNLMAELTQALILVNSSDFSSDKKEAMKNKINFLVQDSAKHAGMIVGLIKKVNNSNAKEY